VSSPAVADLSTSSAATDEGLPLVAWGGLVVGVCMLALSTTGILWRIDTLSVSLSLVAALGVSALALGRFQPRLVLAWPYVLLLSALLVIPLLASSAPPYHWDEVAYTATLPRDYARAGRFFYNGDYGSFSAFPANYEAVTTAGLVLVGNVTAPRVLNVILMWGLALSAASLSVRLGVPRGVAPIAAVLVLAAPVVHASALMVKNDLAAGFFQALTLLALAAFSSRRSPAVLALAGFFLGTAVGTKYSSLTFALCVAPLALLLIVRGSPSRVSCLRGTLAFGMATVVTALPWYGRNLVLLGNPFFPFFNDILGADNAFTALHSTLNREMFDGLTDYSWHSGTVRTFLAQVGAGFGWLPLVLSIPGLWVAVGKRRSEASLLLAAAFVSYGLVTLVAGYWLPRFFVSQLVLASALAALFVAEILRAEGLRSHRWRADTLLVAFLVLSIGGTALRREHDARRGLIEALYGQDRPEFIRSHVPYWDVAHWINLHTVPGARVGMGLQLKPFFYLERPYFNIQPLNEKGNLQALETADEYLRAFHAIGLEWVAVNRWRPGRTYLRSRAPHVIAFRKRFERAMDTLSRDGRLELAAVRSGVRIFRVPAPDAGRGGPPVIH
jgi:hypothetical protein